MEVSAPPSRFRLGALVAWALVGAAALCGCHSWPFYHKDRTTIITPPMRVAAIREIGPRGRDATQAEQQKMCEQLAAQIRTEADPIVRRAIQETIAEFENPLAEAVLTAGLDDDDRDVRMVCCRLLGERKADAAAAKLSVKVSTDPDIDVRMAAVDALGQLKGSEAIKGLAVAVKDRDPAMQFAGVEAMKSSTGEDLGNDVSAWRLYADKALGGAQETAVATKPGATTTK